MVRCRIYGSGGNSCHQDGQYSYWKIFRGTGENELYDIQIVDREGGLNFVCEVRSEIQRYALKAAFNLFLDID